ncbi:MAG: hypothetical protein AAGA77_08560 [Bacteroidota bacterium]
MKLKILFSVIFIIPILTFGQVTSSNNMTESIDEIRQWIDKTNITLNLEYYKRLDFLTSEIRGLIDTSFYENDFEQGSIALNKLVSFDSISIRKENYYTLNFSLKELSITYDIDSIVNFDTSIFFEVSSISGVATPFRLFVKSSLILKVPTSNVEIKFFDNKLSSAFSYSWKRYLVFADSIDGTFHTIPNINSFRYRNSYDLPSNENAMEPAFDWVRREFDLPKNFDYKTVHDYDEIIKDYFSRRYIQRFDTAQVFFPEKNSIFLKKVQGEISRTKGVWENIIINLTAYNRKSHQKLIIQCTIEANYIKSSPLGFGPTVNAIEKGDKLKSTYELEFLDYRNNLITELRNIIINE